MKILKKKKKHLNLDRHHIEKRHDRRFLGIFLMFVVIAVFIGFVLAFTIKSSITGGSIFGIDWIWAKPTTESAGASMGGAATGSSASRCIDSDGGIKPYKQGTVRYNGKTYTDFCWENGTNVPNSKYVSAEFYCWNNVADRSLMYCPSGCSNGACVNVTQVKPGFSDDTPGYQLDEMKDLCMNAGSKCENSMN